jgi:hypothetical protein
VTARENVRLQTASKVRKPIAYGGNQNDSITRPLLHAGRIEADRPSFARDRYDSVGNSCQNAMQQERRRFNQQKVFGSRLRRKAQPLDVA